jgi:hypothetical protein
MMLDNHRIVIRERGYLELLDLGLRVLRSQAGPLFLALLAGIGPFVVLNAWLLDRAATVPAGSGPPGTFLVMMLIAVLWELPLATAPATMVLGRTLFNRPLDAGQIAREFAQSLPQLVLYQVLLRGLLLATVAGSFVPFIANPYLNEVILLERNPLQASRQERLSTGPRSAMLHGGQGGDFFVRWLLNTVIGSVLVAAFWGSLAVAARSLLNEQDWTSPFYTCLYPAALWIVAAYFGVVRFLGYLDLRIRREGWEVELLMRAELDRWTRMQTSGTP